MGVTARRRQFYLYAEQYPEYLQDLKVRGIWIWLGVTCISENGRSERHHRHSLLMAETNTKCPLMDLPVHLRASNTPIS